MARTTLLIGWDEPGARAGQERSRRAARLPIRPLRSFHLTTDLAFHAQQLLFTLIWPQLGPEGEDLDQIKAIVAQALDKAAGPES